MPKKKKKIWTNEMQNYDYSVIYRANIKTEQQHIPWNFVRNYMFNISKTPCCTSPMTAFLMAIKTDPINKQYDK